VDARGAVDGRRVPAVSPVVDGRLTCFSGHDLGDAGDPYADPGCLTCLREEIAPLADDPTEVVEQIKHHLISIQEGDERAIPVELEDESGDRFGLRADGWRVARIVVQVEPVAPR
jgi:hypothetical protein